VDVGTLSALERLARCLEDQLAALQHLSFKFEVQEAVLGSGRQRWLDQTTRELELSVDALHGTDTALRAALSTTAIAVGLSPEATVREIAAAVPEPWSYVFTEHRASLQAAVERVARSSRTNRRLLAAGYAATAAALAFLGAQVPVGYDATGAPTPVTGSLGLLDARA
jgi:hypothetical protein